jgi:protein-L-isoaspartate(D-aspartate) O-methyltransferase
MIETDYTTGFEAARKNMVEHQIRCCKVLDADLLDMLETMPRDQFLPEDIRSLAYMEGHAPLPNEQEMLTPLQEATIMQHLRLQGTESVLLIGAGSGFLATLLAMRAAHVTACELHANLTSIAKKNIADHGAHNVTVMQLNAMDPQATQKALGQQSFDVLVIAAASHEVPAHLRAYVHDHGQIISFIGSNPVVTMQHEQRQGVANIVTPLLETSLLPIEGTPKVRKLDF